MMYIDKDYTPVYCSPLFLRELNLDAGLSESLKRKYDHDQDKGHYRQRCFTAFLGIEEFTNIQKVFVTNPHSKGDCIYKIDLVFKIDGKHYGIQLKSSMCGVNKHHLLYGDGIHGSFSINCPAVVIPERSILFFSEFLEFIGAEWSLNFLKLIHKVELLQEKGINEIPIQIFSNTEKRLLKFLGYKIDNNYVYLN